MSDHPQGNQPPVDGTPPPGQPPQPPGQPPGDPNDEWGSNDDGSNMGSDDVVQQKVIDPAYKGDKTFYKLLLWFLGLTVLIGVIGLLILAGCGKDLPDGLIAIVSTAVGALGGVLTTGSK